MYLQFRPITSWKPIYISCDGRQRLGATASILDLSDKHLLSRAVSLSKLSHVLELQLFTYQISIKFRFDVTISHKNYSFSCA
jgi:hypothetical protein